jgi:hypothetical protein
VNDQLYAVATLCLVKEPLVPAGYKAWWVPKLVWTMQTREKLLHQLGIEPRFFAVWPVASSYTDWAMVKKPELKKLPIEYQPSPKITSRLKS